MDGLGRLVMPALFVLCALPVLLFLAARVPTGEIPDEVAHILRAESLRWGQVVGFRQPRLDPLGATIPDSGVLAHHSMLAAGFTSNPTLPLAQRRVSLERIEQLRAMPWGAGPAFVSIPNTSVYAPVMYVPAAIGIQVAKWTQRGPWTAILFGRTANALAYVAIGLVALLMARRLQGLLFATLVLPMSLWLAASCNQDGLVIATAVLSAALLTRQSWGGWWGAVAALALVVMAKPLYLPLAGAVFVLAPVRGMALGTRLLGMVAAIVPGVAWYAFAQARAAAPFVRGEAYKAGPLWPGTPGEVFGTIDAGRQLRVLLHDPALMLTLPIEAMQEQAGWLLREFVGLLGLLDVFLPGVLFAGWLYALAALLVGECVLPRRTVPGAGWLGCGAVALCVVASVFALFDGQYLSWTPTGAARAEGVQGRYFLPLLPFLALALPSVQIAGGGAVRWVLRAPAIACGLVGISVIPALVLTVYYLR